MRSRSTPDHPGRAPRGPWVTVMRWFDTGASAPVAGSDGNRVDWLRAIPFVAMHLACLAVIWVGGCRGWR